MNRLLHIPEGFRDIYRDENRSRIIIRKRLTDLLESFGYAGIETPGIEYFDVFGRDIGTTPSKELYKFFDRDGNTIVLRPDFTPAVARAAATYFNDEKRPLRLFYDGNVYQNNKSYQGRLRESSQIGAELIGISSLDADAEILTMIVRMFEASGLQDFQISVSHSHIFEALLTEAGFDEDEEEVVRDLIENKNFFGLEEYLGQKGISTELEELFSLLGPAYEPMENWEHLLKKTEKFPEIHADLHYLQELYKLLTVYGVENHIAFDLGQISTFTYYTGIIFTGYTFGTGEPLVRGGRYDKLLSNFGADAASIGFAFTLDQLMMALERQKIPVIDDLKHYVLLYRPEDRASAIAKATELRKSKASVEMIVSSDPGATIELLKNEYSNTEFILWRAE